MIASRLDERKGGAFEGVKPAGSGDRPGGRQRQQSGTGKKGEAE
ncbi:hypothetical protein [Nonomuraea angiospora]|nr:hypothetical protein [Nonomuraea angiospora]MDX3105082.1 hypothetical protein [Nonomuraea angiospora]